LSFIFLGRCWPTPKASKAAHCKKNLHPKIFWKYFSNEGQFQSTLDRSSQHLSETSRLVKNYNLKRFYLEITWPDTLTSVLPTTVWNLNLAKKKFFMRLGILWLCVCKGVSAWMKKKDFFTLPKSDINNI
jgi:hypothetical protein